MALSKDLSHPMRDLQADRNRPYKEDQVPYCRRAPESAFQNSLNPRNSPDIAIRGAGAPDAMRIAAIAEAAFEVYIERIGRRPAPMDDDFDALIAAGKVIVAGTPALGYAVSWSLSDVWHLSAVAVMPEAAGKGIGRSLIAAVEQIAAENGAIAVELYTHAAMSENRKLYPMLGYHITGQRTENGFRRVYFRKLLGAREIPG